MSEVGDIGRRYLGKRYGKYRGVVTNIRDDKKMGRVMAHVYNIHFEDPDTGEKPSTPWALPAAGGNFNSGQFFLPAVGQTVWVEFEEGDTDKPIWSHGPWTLWTGKSDVPRHSRGVYDDSDNHMRGTEDIPGPKANGSYGTAQGISTPGGSKIEIDDTPGNERVVIEHPTGSRYEILSDGSCQDISTNRREVYNGKQFTRVTGARELTVDGSTIQTYNTRDVKQNGEYTQVNIKGATYTFKNRETTLNSDSRIIQGSDSVEVYGNQTTNILGNSNTNVLGECNMTLQEFSLWYATLGLQLNPGPSPLSYVTVARTPYGVFADFVVKATELIFWLATHTHGSSAGPTSPPLIPPSPTMIATSLRVE